MSTVIRHGTARDAGAVAELHSASWRTAYAGLVPDEALGDGLAAERREIWELRLAADYGGPETTPELLIAERDGDVVGFAYVVPHWDGRILLDNLHVRPGLTGGGIGRELVDAARRHTARRHPGTDLYLEVLQANTRAVAFYEREGAHRTDAREGVFPGGHTLPEYEYTWPASELARHWS
ncbi:GNAT family N-acetyltransferase [Kitasatospora sp. NPDC008115]|uniref:GNAT family N-acetyltransferase n=1 Tax=Kitasatospora sp. NPDC008115 TaxID=3364022 RepID=UPI0036E6CDAA